jgi:4-amino-4-deoxy-L-arabinose transferase-like glycosyltransferase
MLVLIFAIWLLLYGSFTLFTPPLLDDADSVHAEVAREMLLRHDPVTLYANGIRYLEKAPLLYWSMAASFRIFGVSTAAARIPLALYTLALLLVVFAFARRLFPSGLFASDLAGLYAALILATSFGIFIFTRILIPDVIVCLWTTLALLFFWQSIEEREPSRATAIGFAAACALNVLTKGLIGIVFPLLIMVAFLLLTRNLRHLRRWHPLLGAAVFLVIAAPWHIAAGLANPTQGHPTGLLPTFGNVRGFFWFYFVNEHLLRYLNRRVPRDYDTVPLTLFWALLLVWLMPWCAFLVGVLASTVHHVVAAGARFRRPLSSRYTSRQKAWLLLALWAAIPMLFFSFSTRQEYYALPVLPPLALAIGAWLAQAEEPREAAMQRVGMRIAIALAILGTLAGAVSAFLVLHAGTAGQGADLASVLKQNPGEYALSFGHFLDLSSQAMAFFRLPLLAVAIASLLGTVGHLVARARRRPRLANACLAAMAVTFLLAAHAALVTFSTVLSSEQLAKAVRPSLHPSDILVINGEYESGSTLGFYLRRQVRILNGRSSNLWYGSFFPDAPKIFENEASLALLWSGSDRVFLWTELDHLPALPAAAFTIASDGGKAILSNQPARQDCSSRPASGAQLSRPRIE